MPFIAPLNEQQLKYAAESGEGIKVSVVIDLVDLIDNDLEGLNDLVEREIVWDHPYILEDIQYQVLGHQPPEHGAGSVILEVSTNIVAT